MCKKSIIFQLSQGNQHQSYSSYSLTSTFYDQSEVCGWWSCVVQFNLITFNGLKLFYDSTVGKKWHISSHNLNTFQISVVANSRCLNPWSFIKCHILTLHIPFVSSLSFSLQMFPVFTRLWWRWFKGGGLAFSACDRATVRTVCKPFECCLNTPQPPIHPTHAREPNNTSKLPPIAPALTPTSPFS